jgi:hypothetical protein
MLTLLLQGGVFVGLVAFTISMVECVEINEETHFHIEIEWV